MNIKHKLFLLCFLSAGCYATSPNNSGSGFFKDPHKDAQKYCKKQNRGYDCYYGCQNGMCIAHKKAYHELKDDLEEKSKMNPEEESEEGKSFPEINIKEHSIEDGESKEKIENENNELRVENEQLNQNIKEKDDDIKKKDDELEQLKKEIQDLKAKNTNGEKKEFSTQTTENFNEHKDDITEISEESYDKSMDISELKKENAELKKQLELQQQNKTQPIHQINFENYTKNFMNIYDDFFASYFNEIQEFEQSEKKEATKYAKEISGFVSKIEKEIKKSIFDKAKGVLEVMTELMSEIKKHKNNNFDDENALIKTQKKINDYLIGLDETLDELNTQHEESVKNVTEQLTDYNNSLLIWMENYPVRLGVTIENFKRDKSDFFEKAVELILERMNQSK